MPEGWQLTPFPETIRDQRVRVVKVQQSSYQRSGRFPIIDQGQQFIAGFWDGEDEVYEASLPAIVFGDHTRVFKFVDFPFVAGADGTHVFAPDTTRFDSFFLYLALSSLDIPSRGYNRHFRLLKERAIITPPLPEQRAIAGVLRTVQRAKEACEQVLAATRQLKASLLRHLFTYGPVPFPQADRVPLKATKLGSMPANWSLVRVGDLGDVVTGSTPSTKHPEYYGGSHMFIAPGDLGASKYIARSKKGITDEGLEQCRILPKKAVVVVCIGATIGKTGLTTEDGCATNQQCNAIIADGKCDPEFLFYALSNRAWALPLLAGRAAVPIVNKSNFCDFEIALPPLSEQREIARQLAAVDAKLAALEMRRGALASLFASMLHHLMTGRVRLPAAMRAGAAQAGLPEFAK